MSDTQTLTAELVLGEPQSQQLERKQSSEPASLMAVIGQAVMTGTTSVDVMQALLDMQFKVETRQAEVEFNAALARMMPKLPRVEKSGVIYNKDGKTIRSRFAYFEDIDAAIRPFLAEEGFSFSFNTDDVEARQLKVTGTLSHRLGHSRSSSFKVPTENPVITGGQAVGAACSFAKRYIVVNMLNIVTVGEDSDGQPKQKPITDEQVLELEMALSDTGANTQRFLSWAGVTKLSEIIDSNFETAMKTIRETARKR